MPSPFHWFERLGNVIALRLKHPRNQGRTQHNTTTADDTSIRTDLPNPVPPPIFASSPSSVHPVSASSEPGLEEFHNGFPPPVYPFGPSTVREISDIAQVVLPPIQAVTGVIPVAGTAMNAAIAGLLATLQVINKCDQNKAAVDDLRSRLGRLSQHLSNAPPASDLSELYRRDVLTRKLQDTSARLRKLPKHRLPYPSVTQAITGCSTDINNYLAEYSFSCQMQDRCEIREVHELLITLQRRLEDRNIEPFVASSASHLPATVMTGCVTLVDATGHHHQISVNLCTSYQQFNDMLRVLFQRDLIEAQIQRRYIEEGKYDLCIDQGTQVTPLTSHHWSRIEPGTKVVLRVTIQQMTKSGCDVNYPCHFCGALNRLGAESVKYETQRKIVCATDCWECNRRFQITRRMDNTLAWKERTRLSNSDSNHTTDTETRLIRNFHVEQIYWLYDSDDWWRLKDSDDWWRLKRRWLRLLRRSRQEEFLRRVRESSGTYPPLAHVAPSHYTGHGSSGIEQIESDSDEDEEEDGTETDSDEEEDGAETDSDEEEDGAETDSDEEEYWTDTDSDDVDGRGFQN